jgi:hypothetical protein
MTDDTGNTKAPAKQAPKATSSKAPAKQEPQAERSRATSDMRPDEEQAFNSHREGGQGDPLDRIKPNRDTDRVAIGSQANLSGVEPYIKKGFVGYWHLLQSVEAAANGGYGIARDHAGNIVRRPAGNGDNELILMEIPRAMWDKDQAAKNKTAIDAMAEAAKIDTSKSEYSGTNDSTKSVEATGLGNSPLYN